MTIEKIQYPLLSVHIEKTAGTSLERFWGEMFGRDKLLIYNPDTDGLLQSSNIAGLRTSKHINFARELIGKTNLYPYVQRLLINFLRQSKKVTIDPTDVGPEIKVVHGHYSADRFDAIFPDSTLAIVFRDPLERTISHYKHWKRTKGQLTHRVTIPYQAGVTFSEFALFPELINYQSSALAGKSLSEFGIVGTADKLDQFMQKVMIITKSAGIVTNIHLNRSPSNIARDELGITEQFIKHFKVVNNCDYRLYEIVNSD